jgi:hypothetical protein
MPIRRRRAPVKKTMKALMTMMRKPRARVGGRRRVSGRGILDSIRSGLSSANDFLRDNRLISRGLRMIPGKYSKPLADLADTAGYGRKRRSGRGILDSIKSGLSSVNNFLRDNRLISRGLRMIPGKYSQPLATLADTAGYGRRRAPARHRMGGMMLSPPFMGGMKMRRRVGGRVVFPAVYTTGLGGLSATTM